MINICYNHNPKHYICTKIDIKKMKKNILEVTTAMMPLSEYALSHDNKFYLSDTLEQENPIRSNYNDRPIKLMFSTIIICVDADIDMRINLKEIHLSPGCMLYIPEGSILDIVRYNRPSRFVSICISDVDTRFVSNTSTEINMLRIYSHDVTPTHLEPIIVQRLVEVYLMLKKSIEDPMLKYRNDAIRGYLLAFAAYASSAIETQQETTTNSRISRGDELFNQFLILVRQHHAQYREVAFYADKLNITPKYLGAIVNKASDRRPLDWISDFTILDAKAMLASRQYTVQQVSDTLNFPNASFFVKYFKKAVGCTPGQYMNKIQK